MDLCSKLSGMKSMIVTRKDHKKDDSGDNGKCSTKQRYIPWGLGVISCWKISKGLFTVTIHQMVSQWGLAIQHLDFAGYGRPEMKSLRPFWVLKSRRWRTYLPSLTRERGIGCLETCITQLSFIFVIWVQEMHSSYEDFHCRCKNVIFSSRGILLCWMLRIKNTLY